MILTGVMKGRRIDPDLEMIIEELTESELEIMKDRLARWLWQLQTITAPGSLLDPPQLLPPEEPPDFLWN